MNVGDRVQIINGVQAGTTGTITRNPESSEWHDDDSVWITYDWSSPGQEPSEWFEIDRLKVL